MNIYPTNINFLYVDGLHIAKGADFLREVEVYDRDNDGTEVPVDYSGWQAYGTIKLSAQDEEKVADIQVSIDGNKFTLFIDSADTAKIPADGRNFSKCTKYTYDIMVQKEEELYRLFNGFIDVSPNVTEED